MDILDYGTYLIVRTPQGDIKVDTMEQAIDLAYKLMFESDKSLEVA